MKLFIALAGLLLWTAPLSAETYSWVDEHGTYNYTEDYSRVPKKYRSSVGKRGDLGASPVSKESARPSIESAPPSTGPGVTPPAASKNTADGKLESPVGNFGGKSYDQWKQDLSDRETAMRVIRKRVDEIDVLLNKNPSNTEQTQGLIAERNRAVGQFAEMRRQYDQQVELARKAGIQVNITQ